MPIYEYQCQACGHRLEKLQKISDEKLKDCPSCSKPELQKLVSAAGFRLKGGGWYETDFKSGSKKNVAESGSASSTDGKSDSKPTSESKSSESKSSESKASDSKSSKKSDGSAAAS